MPDYQILAFEDRAVWRQWLDEHHANTNGVWLRMYKKASGVSTVTYAEALDEALCYGWIDGQVKKYDEASYIQKFTPRRQKSLWSKRNIGLVEALTAAGVMTPAGVAEVERAKADGRWQAAYDRPSEMVVPADFLAELHKYPQAEAFYQTLNKTSRYAIAWKLQTAKTDETRQRRRDKLIAMLQAGQKP